MARRSSRTPDGIRCPGFFGAAPDSHSASDLESGTSEALAGAGATGDTTGMIVEHSSTITRLNRTVGTLATAIFITVISITVTLAMGDSAMATLTTAASTTAMRSTVVRTFTPNQGRTPARSVALITAETSEGFPHAGGRALEVVAVSTEVVPMAVAGGTRDRIRARVE